MTEWRELGIQYPAPTPEPAADSPWPFVAAVALVCATAIYITRRITR